MHMSAHSSACNEVAYAGKQSELSCHVRNPSQCFLHIRPAPGVPARNAPFRWPRYLLCLSAFRIAASGLFRGHLGFFCTCWTGHHAGMDADSVRPYLSQLLSCSVVSTGAPAGSCTPVDMPCVPHRLRRCWVRLKTLITAQAVSAKS
jgi:hypothetical protein